MPLAAEANVPAPQVAVEVSAVVDLYAFLSGCGYDRGRALNDVAAGPALIERVATFWEEDAGTDMAFDELAVLAAVGGFLPGGESTDEFLTALPELAARPPVSLRLRTEQEETRERTRRHLESLYQDPERRARYVTLVGDAAEALRPRWVANLSSLRARAGWLRDRLGAGEDLASLLPPRHLALLPRYRGLVEEGMRLGQTLVVPTVGPDIVYDLPRVMLVGIRLQADGSVEAARQRTARVAERLRALGDPTRLAIAAYLTAQPSSVSGLARAFGLSQPTVSAHIRSLRSAGLLDSHRSGGMTEFRLAEAHLTDLFQEAQQALFGDRS